MRIAALALAGFALVVTSSAARASPLPRPAEWARDSGLTLQLGVGGGGLAALVGDHSGLGTDSPALYVDGAVGAFLDPQAAAVLRVAVATPIGDDGPTETAIFVGPGIQVHGLGEPGGPLFSTTALALAIGHDPTTGRTRFGWGWDLRFGYRVDTGSEHTVAVTVGTDLGSIDGGWLTSYTVALAYVRR